MKYNKIFCISITLLAVIILNGASSVLIAQGVKVIVVDAGHGGSISPGATYHGVKEKDIVLPIALRVGELIEDNLKGITVVYTRKSDKALGTTITEDLRRRTALANEAKGDLFVSIHANAAASSSAKGVETITMGESSVEQQRNDAVIYANNREDLIDMSDQKTAAIVRAYIQNLQFTYGEYSVALARSIQNNYGKYDRSLRRERQQLLMVLYGVDMPSVLTEIGFMTNATEFAYMTSKRGQEEIAQSIYGGIRDYVEMINGTLAANNIATNSNNTPQKEPKATSSTAQGGGDYTIQILSSRKEIKESDSQFKIYRNNVWCFKGSGRYKYKYCTGHYATSAEAAEQLKEVRKYFSDAFVVKYAK
ncbi:MAG: N-acetylmuramoyl-L-alanine amidase [Rikenellaceae bacterium]